MNFTFLGTGTSHGIPVIGCSCRVCTSTEIKNIRRRCSLYIVTAQKHFVIDTPPDFREQVLRFGVSRVDALFLTHSHADHIFGFDDIRRFSTLQKAHIPVYGSKETIRDVQTKFPYVARKGYSFDAVPRVTLHIQTAPVKIGAATITPLPVQHGTDTIYGFLIEGDGKRLGYIPDCNAIPPSTMQQLQEMDVMILDGLRPQKHPTHFTISEACEVLAQIGAQRSFITHITHDSEHHELQTQLQESVTVPWDGLQVEL